MNTYTGSKGEIPFAGMPYSYLKNATLKAERTAPGTPQTLALRAELDRREERREMLARQSDAERW